MNLERKVSRRNVLRVGGIFGLTYLLESCGMERKLVVKDRKDDIYFSSPTHFPSLEKEETIENYSTPYFSPTPKQEAQQLETPQPTLAYKPEYFPKGGVKSPEEALKERAADIVAENIYGVKGNLIRRSDGSLGDIYLIRETTEKGKKNNLEEGQLGYFRLDLSNPLNSRIDFVPNNFRINDRSYTSLRWEFDYIGNEGRKETIERIVFINERGGIEYLANPSNGKEQLIAKGGILPEIDNELAKAQKNLPNDNFYLELQRVNDGGYSITVIDAGGNRLAYWNKAKERFEEEIILEQNINVRNKPTINPSTLATTLKKGDSLILTGILLLEKEKWYMISLQKTPSLILAPVLTPTAVPTVTATLEIKEEIEKLLFVHSSVIPNLSKEQLSLLRVLRPEDLPVEVRPGTIETKTPEVAEGIYRVEGKEWFGGFDLSGIRIEGRGRLGFRDEINGPRAFFDEYMKVIAAQKNVSVEELERIIIGNNGLLTVTIPEADPDYSDLPIPLALPKDYVVDFKKPLKITHSSTAPTYFSKIRVGSVYRGEKEINWYAVHSKEGQLTITFRTGFIIYDEDEVPKAVSAFVPMALAPLSRVGELDGKPEALGVMASEKERFFFRSWRSSVINKEVFYKTGPTQSDPQIFIFAYR
jgi:hypothetical protein